MKGRKPVPTSLKLIRGNPGRRPIDLDGEPQPPVEEKTPGPPAYLPPIAKKVWREIAPSLHLTGRLTVDDGPLLAALCLELSQWRESIRQMGELAKGKDNPLTGAIIKTADGTGLTYSILQKLKNRSLQNILPIAALFGLSPAERARLKIAPKEESKSAADKFRAKKRG